MYELKLTFVEYPKGCVEMTAQGIDNEATNSETFAAMAIAEALKMSASAVGAVIDAGYKEKSK